MTIVTEGRHAAAFILSEASGNRSRASLVIAAGAGLVAAGTVLGMFSTGDVTVASAAKAGGNTGTGTLTLAAAPSSAAVKSGVYQVRGKATVKAATPTVQAGANKGSIAMESTPFAAGVKVGTWKVVAIEAPGAGEAAFQVEDPDGVIVGTGATGAAFNGDIKFTWTKGSATAVGDVCTVAIALGMHATTPSFTVVDPTGVALADAVAGSAYDGAIKFTIAQGDPVFIASDGFDVTVTAVDAGKYGPSPYTGTLGHDVACAINLYAVDATSEDVAVAGIARDTEVNGKLLTFHSTVDDAAKKAVKAAQLASAGIIVR